MSHQEAGGASDIQWIEARDGAKHLTLYRAVLQQRIVQPTTSMLRLGNPAPDIAQKASKWILISPQTHLVLSHLFLQDALHSTNTFPH